MDPNAPSQPSSEAAYNTAGNPIDHTPRERNEASSKVYGNIGTNIDSRVQGDVSVPSSHGGGGLPSSLGYGSRTGEGDRPNVKVTFSLISYMHVS
jgi:hypothetical protein